jgi:hypothetical protein
VFAEKLRACLQNQKLAEAPNNNVITDADPTLYLGILRSWMGASLGVVESVSAERCSEPYIK